MMVEDDLAFFAAILRVLPLSVATWSLRTWLTFALW
jgi:hypothetical protein